MRVVEIRKAGRPKVLRLREVPDPEPGDDQIVIDVQAAGINFADIHGRMGLYPDAPPFPYVPGYEVAGYDPDGNRVMAVTRFGGYSEKVVVAREQCCTLPDTLSFEEGAAIPVNYITAWVALWQMARISDGEKLLVEHGAGGVGLAALQIAKNEGAEVWSVTSSEEKAEFLREKGANPIIRGKDEWPYDLDVIMDPTGASGIMRDFEHLGTGGRIILFGGSEYVTGRKRNAFKAAWKYMRRPKLDPLNMMTSNKGIFGLNLLTYWKKHGDLADAFSALIEGIKDGWLRPHVGAVFPLERAAEAHEFIQDRKNLGKVVLLMTEAPQPVEPVAVEEPEPSEAPPAEAAPETEPTDESIDDFIERVEEDVDTRIRLRAFNSLDGKEDSGTESESEEEIPDHKYYEGEDDEEDSRAHAEEE